MAIKTRVIVVDPAAPDAAAIEHAALALGKGQLVAFPTETVYGLGAHALDPEAVRRLFDAKGRPSTDPVIVHIAHLRQLGTIAAAVPPVARRLARAFWPGPLTLILQRRAMVPDAVTAGRPTVGVRVPAHPVADALLQFSGLPIAAPSANRFSRPSPTSAQHVLADLDGRVDIVIDAGPTPVGVESTILDLTAEPPVVRRPGGVSFEALQAVVPDAHRLQLVLDPAVSQPAPGQLLRHYAPSAPMTLYLGSVDRVAMRMGDDARSLAASGERVGILAPEEDLLMLAPRLAAAAAGGRVVTKRCGARRDPASTARELFAALRALDREGPGVILASAGSPDGIGAAVVDRLLRAAEGRVVHV